MTLKRNLLVTLADKNYINQAKQLFSSVYFNSCWKGDYMLLSYNIPEEELKWFRDKGIIVKRFNKIESKSYGYYEIALFKFYLFKPYFKKWKNVIFLDSDIIVRGSLNELTHLKGFWAVPDYFNIKISSILDFKKEYLQFNKIKKKYHIDKDKSFNAGLIVFNTNIIDKNDFYKIINIFEKYKHTPFLSEQDCLNIFFYNKWKKLSIIYNFNPYSISLPFFNLRNPGKIIHFSGKYKPWDEKSRFYNEWKHNLESAEKMHINKSLINLSSRKFNNLNSIHKLTIMFNKLLMILQILLKRYIPKLNKLVIDSIYK